jgi:hypothetical protein
LIRPSTARRNDLSERLKIYADYKKLINEILNLTLLRPARKRGEATMEHLYMALAELVAEENFEIISNLNVFESLKYMFAVEDFNVFRTFMEDMNTILNDQSAVQLAEYHRLQEIER